MSEQMIDKTMGPSSSSTLFLVQAAARPVLDNITADRERILPRY